MKTYTIFDDKFTVKSLHLTKSRHLGVYTLQVEIQVEGETETINYKVPLRDTELFLAFQEVEYVDRYNFLLEKCASTIQKLVIDTYKSL